MTLHLKYTGFSTQIRALGATFNLEYSGGCLTIEDLTMEQGRRFAELLDSIDNLPTGGPLVGASVPQRNATPLRLVPTRAASQKNAAERDTGAQAGSDEVTVRAGARETPSPDDGSGCQPGEMPEGVQTATRMLDIVDAAMIEWHKCGVSRPSLRQITTVVLSWKGQNSHLAKITRLETKIERSYSIIAEASR